MYASVRLACVRHAASVRPEPGSNSLKYCIPTSFDVTTYLRAFALIASLEALLRTLTLLASQFTVFRNLLFSKAISRFTQSYYGFLCFVLFNFQGPLLSRGQPVKYITSLLPCQELFSNF